MSKIDITPEDIIDARIDGILCRAYERGYKKGYKKGYEGIQKRIFLDMCDSVSAEELSKLKCFRDLPQYSTRKRR
ncbi:hypothetical protein [Methanobrevibacter sp.]